MHDLLTIEDLELMTRIGISEEERATPQKILATIGMDLSSSRPHSDDLSQSIDYARVTEAVRLLAEEEHRTMEFFAEEIAAAALKFKIASVRVTVRKFALPGLRSAAITIVRP